MRKPCSFYAKDRVYTTLLCLAMLGMTTSAWAGDTPEPTAAAGTSHDVSELRQELNTAVARIDELQRKLEQKQTAEEIQQKLNSELEHVEAMQKRLDQVAAAYVPQDTTGAASNVQQPTNTASPAATPAGPSLASLLGPTTFSGFVDTYYQQNFNNPSSRANTLRPFDVTTNQFGLNLIELVVDKPPDATASRTGYHIALGYGEAMNVVNASEPVAGLSFDQYLKEAYFSYLAPVGRGLQVDVGKFVTPAGAEVIETKDNWNYSRGLLFGYAIPFFHFGMRAKYTFSDKYAITGFFVNGWNDVVANNTGKTGGLTFNWNPNKKFGIAQTFLIGPEETAGGALPNVNSYYRQLWDTVATYNATSKLSLMANFDYGRGDRTVVNAVPLTLSKPVWWSGIAGYMRYALNDRYALATRYEYYDDKYGFTTGGAQHLQEVTGTVERLIAHRIISRFEYRYDVSNIPFFPKGVRPVSTQNTLSAGLVYTFNSQEAK